MNNFNRNTTSMNPRIVHYPPDGGGRDTYVKFDNGGFYASSGKKNIHSDQYDMIKYQPQFYSKKYY